MTSGNGNPFNQRVPPGQLTQQFSRFTPSAHCTVQRTVVIEPVRAEPVQQTVVIEPFRAESGPPCEARRETQAAKLSPQLAEVTQGPLLADTPLAIAQDTVAFTPFSKQELERPPVVAKLSPPNLEPSATAYFEPMHVPKELLPRKRATNAPVTSDVRGLSRLGQLSKQKPLLIWLGGAVLAFSLSAAASFAVRSALHPSPVRSRAQAQIAAAGTAKPQATAPIPNEIAASETAKHVPPQSIEVIPFVAQTALQTPAKKGQAIDPDLSAAAGHLIAGRYEDAQRAYADVAARTQNDPALAAVSHLLGKKLGPNCAGTTPSIGVNCPEVKP